MFETNPGAPPLPTATYRVVEPETVSIPVAYPPFPAPVPFPVSAVVRPAPPAAPQTSSLYVPAGNVTDCCPPVYPKFFVPPVPDANVFSVVFPALSVTITFNVYAVKGPVNPVY